MLTTTQQICDRKFLTKDARSSLGRPSCGSRLGSRWYVAEAQPQKLNSANYELIGSGFNTYIALQKTQIRETVKGKRNGHLTVVVRPMFFQFFFVQFDIDADPWGKARSAPGIRGLLGSSNGRPQPVAVGVVERLISTASARLNLKSVGMMPLQSGALAKVITRDWDEPHWLDGHVVQVKRCDGFTTNAEFSFLGRRIQAIFGRDELTDE
jgi:transcription antitermination factor NusG